MKREKILSQMWWILGILLSAILILWPLGRPGFFISDDGEWMIIRLSAFYQSWREGQFPVRFLGRLNYSYGYPVANFLYPGFLYLGSLIHLLGFSFSDSIKIILGGSVLAAALFIFKWLRLFFSSLASFGGVLGFLFAPYLVFDLYKRGSVGEILALAAAASGMYSIGANRRWLLPLSVGLLLISHNSLALLFLVVFIFYIWAERRGNFWVPLLIGIGSATFFWFPALFERRLVIFDSLTISRPSDHFFTGNKLVLAGVVNMAVLFLLLFRKKLFKGRCLGFFLFISALSTLLATSLSLPLWSNQLLVKLLQFPYRTLAVALIVNAWLIAALINYTAARGQIKLLFLFLVLWIVPLSPVLREVKTVVRPESYYTTNEATTTVADEYLPNWVADKPQSRANQKIEFISGKGKISYKIASSQRLEATVEAKAASVIQINTIYYPGWGVVVDGYPAVIDYLSSGGLMRISLPAGSHSLISEFHETLPRFLADLVSLAFTVFYIGYLVRLKNSRLTQTPVRRR